MKKKYQIKEHGNGIFEVILGFWVFLAKPQLIMALQEIGEHSVVTNIRYYITHSLRESYIICTMPKQK